MQPIHVSLVTQLAIGVHLQRHGLCNLVRFIKDSFGHARVIRLVPQATYQTSGDLTDMTLKIIGLVILAIIAAISTQFLLRRRQQQVDMFVSRNR